ncbi:imidazole glycerol phosphate synthase subunit HisH [Candidatus Omnitrophus magneticus]|uniref:Imidazole glycerol phosphate synthase subunit HisH n=1 Tax=Candidatus Omnitrophus magneticus TaxID=1609969 RepID=A0A0F0CUZ7_9BACT|nr:imidazole glycerol phosphate synthase subunit HisH [Candidatus Omnitrophus magneticus]
MITIIDYKMGNIKSLMNALDFLGCGFCFTNSAETILKSEKIILPGVGAFDKAMENLMEFGLIDVLNEVVLNKKIPILGICLGMQILATSGEEHSACKGLGWIQGAVRHISRVAPDARTPHIGFNAVFKNEGKENILYQGLKDGTDFYFVHSYQMMCSRAEDVSGWIEYSGARLTASVQKDNIFGVQFHPEKSQSNGLALLKNFVLGGI